MQIVKQKRARVGIYPGMGPPISSRDHVLTVVTIFRFHQLIFEVIHAQVIGLESILGIHEKYAELLVFV